MYMYRLIHFAVQQKLIQYCKATPIFQEKIIFNSKQNFKTFPFY